MSGDGNSKYKSPEAGGYQMYLGNKKRTGCLKWSEGGVERKEMRLET